MATDGAGLRPGTGRRTTRSPGLADPIPHEATGILGRPTRAERFVRDRVTLVFGIALEILI